MAGQVSRLLLLVILWTSYANAAPKSFSCMSFLEDDRSLQEDDDSEESPSEPQFDTSGLVSSERAEAISLAANPVTLTAHRRVCPTDYTFCFSLWRQTENGTHIEKQGCWKESTEGNATCSHTECVSSAPTSRNNSLYYCCCSGDVCNQNVSVVEPAPLELSKANFAKASNLADQQVRQTFNWYNANLWFALLAASVIITLMASFIYCRGAREKPVPEEAPLAPSGPGYSSNLRNVDNMNLVGMLGSGKYGTVMKGLLHDQEVAVKIFPEAHQQYFINERNIYSLPLMDCPALLTYFGYDERHTMEGKVEYHLVLSLAPLGCLQDWLICNAMNFEVFCGMVKSITRGLSHLHTELRRGDEHKPCIAHRDLNTRNILVKADRTCCVADFGFALKVFGPRYEYKGEIAEAETKSINEVGTLRYMAPELLEGAVNLRDCETSLKQMDVYALGLVLWEVATRCSDFYPPAQVTPPYKAPYELEVGSHPSFDQMQSLVVRHKARPLFPGGWGGGAAAKLVRDTCEDCWDHDAEARLTSLCAEERMHEVSGLSSRLHPHLQSASPLLSANNLITEPPSTDANHQYTRTNNSHNNDNNNVVDGGNSTETATILNPPPNQQIMPPIPARDAVDAPHPATALQNEKNHFMHPQHQLQPYQGRNPCQERNLAPLSTRSPQILIQRSKKHSFQSHSGEENSFSCLEDDVSVEELISGRSSKKFPSMAADETSNMAMGEGFPKQHNTDRKLRGWHGVRALIQKRLFRKIDGGGAIEVFQKTNGADEKCNLVDNRYVAVAKGLDRSPPAKPIAISYIEESPVGCGEGFVGKTPSLPPAGKTAPSLHKRPNNLDLSPIGGHSIAHPSPHSLQSNHIHTIAEEGHHGDGQLECGSVLKGVEKRKCTPPLQMPRSRSSNLSLSKPINTNNNVCEAELKLMAAGKHDAAAEPQFRRQRSLEVFREVFSGRGSNERLRDPSQRVKTPGDVPPSVRKIRASKTLSLYDDRMMDSSTLNIL